MATSDWVTIGSVLLTMLGGMGILLFKTGGMIAEVKTELRVLKTELGVIRAELSALKAEVTALSERVLRLEKQMHKVLRVLADHHYHIKRFRRPLKP